VLYFFVIWPWFMWKDGTREGGGIWKDDLFTTMKGGADTVVLQQA
jgi:hypothetical protein